MSEELEVELFCPNPGCGKVFGLTKTDFRAALRFRKYTGGIPLGSCLHCHHVFKLPEDIPSTNTELEAWMIKADEDPDICCPCVPLLDGRVGKEPSGKEIVNGDTRYRSGDGGSELLSKWDYMFKYGINPETALAANKSMGGKPFEI